MSENQIDEATLEAQLYADTLNSLFRKCHNASRNAGWWHDPETNIPLNPAIEGIPLIGIEREIRDAMAPYVIATKILLIISELTEAMEGHRKGLPDDKLPHRSMLEVELADAVIRIGDLSGALGLDVGGAIAEKMKYNLSRPDHKVVNRRKPGGKLY